MLACMCVCCGKHLSDLHVSVCGASTHEENLKTREKVWEDLLFQTFNVKCSNIVFGCISVGGEEWKMDCLKFLSLQF